MVNPNKECNGEIESPWPYLIIRSDLDKYIYVEYKDIYLTSAIYNKVFVFSF